jgi:hypothetical protein
METEGFLALAPDATDVLYYAYYSILTLAIASIAACCVSGTIRVACVAQVISLVLWSLEKKQVKATSRGSVVSRSSDGLYPSALTFCSNFLPVSSI